MDLLPTHLGPFHPRGPMLDLALLLLPLGLVAMVRLVPKAYRVAAEGGGGDGGGDHGDGEYGDGGRSTASMARRAEEIRARAARERAQTAALLDGVREDDTLADGTSVDEASAGGTFVGDVRPARAGAARAGAARTAGSGGGGGSVPGGDDRRQAHVSDGPREEHVPTFGAPLPGTVPGGTEAPAAPAQSRDEAQRAAAEAELRVTVAELASDLAERLVRQRARVNGKKHG
ncbi:hypothetical protein [Streptomyces uncialis]|uniref:hypothetical protein n=1 Tax=Streptomyces uncialis TaxID=1048205 RepID=UPI0038704830|nr:hypothetical protein OG268_06495 [Streptomyces uncialis]